MAKNTENSNHGEPGLPIIGWREWVSLPDFGVSQIKAKIDTGAKTSAIHAFRVSEISETGIPFVRFFLHPEQQRKVPEIPCTAQIIDQRKIRSSSGNEELRYVIRTKINMGQHSFPIELTLANREDLSFRMLVGRDALKGRFTINPEKSFLLGEPQEIL